MNLLLNGNVDLYKKATKKVHHEFFISFNCLYPVSQTLEARRKFQSKEKLFFVKEIGNT